MKHLPGMATSDKISELNTYIRDCPDRRSATRAKGVLMRLQGKSRREIALSLNVNIDTVSNWITFYRQKGLEGLHSKPQPGNNFKLSPAQKTNLGRIVSGYSPKDLGLPFKSWNIESVRFLINKIYNIEYKSIRSYERLSKAVLKDCINPTMPDYQKLVDQRNTLFSKLENAKLYINPVSKGISSLISRLSKRKP